MRPLDALYAGKTLYTVSFDQHGHIIFTLLPFAVAVGIQRLLAEHPAATLLCEEFIWETCVFEHPYDDLDNTLAGIVSSTARLVLYLSSLPELKDKQTLQKECRQLVAEDFILQAQAIICKAFPAYKPEDLNKLSIIELMQRLAQAEMILNEQFDITAPKKQDKQQSGLIQAINTAEINAKIRQVDQGIPDGEYDLRKIRRAQAR